MMFRPKWAKTGEEIPLGEHHVASRIGNALFGTYNSGRARVELNSFDGTINILKKD